MNGESPMDRARRQLEERADMQRRQQEEYREMQREKMKAANGCALAALIGTMMWCITAIVIALIYVWWA